MTCPEAPLDTDPQPTTDDPAEPPAPPSPPTTPATRRPRPIVLALVLVVLVAGLVVTQVQLAHQRSVNTNLTSDRTSAVATARTDARNVASYDYRHLHQDFTRVEHEATPAFRRSFVQSSGGLTKVLLQYHATASATVLSAGLVSLTSSKAVVILFVNQTVANTAQKGGPTTDNSRIRVTLVRSGSGWLLDKLSLL